ncbi:MAG: phosphoribosylaminoimidazolesuccinocarboxamide synthase [Candidatus Promineifilaceae bacterium]
MLTHEELLQAVPHALETVDVTGWGEKMSGKVRDAYQRDDRLLLITTDRVSAFDRVLGLIPYKGQVLNQLSAWWFRQTADIIPNHMLGVPDPNVMVAQVAEPLPVEVIVRGYITGVTKTSLWTLYAQGERRPYGIPLPDGLQKNDPLPEPLITPTTKAEKGQHDERLTHEQAQALLPDHWDEVAQAAVALFKRGQAVAQQAGLILVDTKYEFGLVNGRVTLIDELHTPDSSRYWVAGSYRPGAEPENFDKEFLRKWFAEQGYRGDGRAPKMPADFIAKVAARYIAAYEKLAGETFVPGEMPAVDRIRAAVNREP